MSDFKANMYSIRLPLGLRGAYSAPPDPVAVFKGPTSKGREAGERGKRKRDGRGRDGREREGQLPHIFWFRTAPDFTLLSGQIL